MMKKGLLVGLGLVAVAVVGYGVYRYLRPDYVNDFEDEIDDDLDDDFFDDEDLDDEEPEKVSETLENFDVADAMDELNQKKEEFAKGFADRHAELHEAVEKMTESINKPNEPVKSDNEKALEEIDKKLGEILGDDIDGESDETGHF